MKTLFASVAALAMIAGAGSAMAAGPINVAVGGTVAKACGLGGQSGGNTTPAATSVDLGALTDAATGQLSTAATTTGVTFNVGNIWCNAPANVSFSATALTTSATTTDTGSFTNSLDLIVDGPNNGAGGLFVYFPGQSVRTGQALSTQINQAFETGGGQYSVARVRAALPTGTQGNDRPVAGTYAGTVTLTVNPQ